MNLTKILRLPLCALMLCPCRHYDDEGGCGGECIHCGRLFGYVTRAELRRYAEAHAAKARSV
jgi:hypothetical protein